MQVKLSNWQVRHDFRVGPEGSMVYNARMDLVGLLTYNGTIGQCFILINHDTTQYESFSDAIVVDAQSVLKLGWQMVGPL